MQFTLHHKSSYTMAEIHLQAGEAIRGESGCMVAMSPNIDIKAKLQGGILRSMARAALGGESAFQTTFTAKSGPGELLVSPRLPGDVLGLEIDGPGLLLQSSGFLCSDSSVDLDTKWGGLKSLFSGEGLFWLRASGQGTVLVSSFGAIHVKRLHKDESYVVDTGHLVGFDASMHYEVKKAASGWFSSVTSGEGLVCHFTGPGTLLIQSRNLKNFAEEIIPFLPKGRPNTDNS